MLSLREINDQIHGLLEVRSRLAGQLQCAIRSDAEVQCRGAFPNRPTWTPAHDCGLWLPVWKAVKCLYCGFYFCERCAEKHFGKTRAEFNAS